MLVVAMAGLLLVVAAAPVSAAAPPARPDHAGPAEPPRAEGGPGAPPHHPGLLWALDVIDISKDLGPGVATAINDRTTVVGHTDGDPWLWENGERTALESLGASAWPEAINDSGDVVGSAETSSGSRRAVRWRGAAIEELEGLGGPAAATAVNGRGEVAGWADDPQGRRHAVRWDGETLTALPDPGGGAAAYGINRQGDIVGSVRVPGTNRQRAALWRENELVDLGQFSAWHWSEARGIGQDGHIVGILEQLEGCCYDGFYLDSAEGTPAHLGWGYYAVPLAVDRRGRAVGYGADENVGSYAYAYLDGRTVSLRGHEWGGAAAYDLNDRGTVAGFADVFDDERDERRAVLWELPDVAPDPDPDPGPDLEPDPDPEADPDPDPEGVPFTCDGLPAGPFADVAGNTHRKAIDCVRHWGIARGVSATEYRPAGSVTRAQMATFIAQSLDLLHDPVAVLPVDAATDAFIDVPADNPHAGNINRLAEAGIVQGRPAFRYDPNDVVTRAQMASFLSRAYEYATDRSPAGDGRWFSDVVGNTHEEAINQVAELGVAGGYPDGTYRPGADVRRDQMASFLSRLLDATALTVHDPAQ